MLIPSLLVLLLSHRLSFPLLVDPTPSSVVRRLDDAFSTLVSDDYFFENADHTSSASSTGTGQETCARTSGGNQCKNLSSLMLFFAFSFFAVTKLGNAKRQTSPLRSTVQVVDDSWFFCFFFGF